MPGTSTDFWNGSGNWILTTSDWSDSSPPATTENAEIQTGTATLVATTSVASLQVDAPATLLLNTGGTLTASGTASIAGSLFLQNGGSVAVSGGGLSITGAGRVAMDAPFIGGAGGSSLTIGGTLTNSSTDGNALDIGNGSITSGDTVTATALNNTGEINIVGAASVQSTLNITAGLASFGTVGVETGTVVLQNDALLEFVSGQISTIDGLLQLSGANARIADAGTLATNSALTGLTTVAGSFFLQNGASVGPTSGGLSITGTGRVALDAPFIGGFGGSKLAIGGALTNSSTDGNALDIGNGSITSGDTVTATALNNTGEINIAGAASVQSTLNITAGLASFGTVGVETGAVVLQNDALLEFVSGQISTIDGLLQLSGANARIADSGTLATNSALTGLTTVAGDFYLQNGASVGPTSGGLSITGTGRVALDAPFIGGFGGSSLTIGGTLTNSSTDGNAFDIGNGSITSGDTVTATALNNTGEINIAGAASVQSTLNITAGLASFGTVGVETGTVVLQNDALLEFVSGQISTIDGLLQLSGANARIADSGTLATNSALTGLTTVAGDFYLQNGASVGPTSGGLTITGTGRVALDAPFIGGFGGSSLTIGGTLTNSSTDGNAFDIGNGSITSGDTVTAAAFTNTGQTSIQGSASVQSTLNITAGMASFGTVGVETGTVVLQNDALLEFVSGQINTINGQLQLNGANARVADSVTPATNSALTGLTTVAGNFYLQNGASVGPTSGGLTITGTGRVALDAPFIGGFGGSKLNIGGTLTNSSTDGNALDIGNGAITSGDTATATAFNNNGETNILGGASAEATLVVNGPATNNGVMDIGAFGEIVMGAGDTYTQAGGSTNISANGVLDPTVVNVTGGFLDGTGAVNGTVNNNGGGTVFGGLTLGTPGTLTVNGTYHQSGTGILEANINSAGTASGVVAVSGGNLDYLSGGTLLLGNTPAVGTVLTVMTFSPGDLLGQFAHVQEGGSIGDGGNVNLGDGTSIEVFYNEDSGNIQIERVSNALLATSYHWINGTANWNTASDWSGGQVPNPTANVVIGDTSTGNVTLNGSSGDTTINSLSILASNTLTVSGVTLTSATGGSGISVASGGTLSLSGNGEINGSVLSGAGLLQTASGTSGILAADTISANTTFVAQNNATTTLEGIIDNIGAISLTGGASTNGALNIGNGVTLTGGGTVALNDQPGAGFAFVQGNSQTLTNSDNTIEGTGIIGNGSLALINGGTVEATPAGGTSTLTLNGSGGVTNNKLLEAKGGGVLVINNTVSNPAGTITVADSSSTVEVASATVQGGIFNNNAGGVLETVGSATLDGSTSGAVTISAKSTYTASNNATTTLDGTIDNLGTLQLIGGASTNGVLAIGNAVTLTGGGVVTLADQTGAGNAFIEGNGQSLTNTNNTIEGTGIIGNGSLVLTNGGTIDATPAGGTSTLTLNGSGGVTNTKLMEATGNGTLVIATNVTNTGANITANGGTSAVVITGGATVTSGTLNTIGTGVVETNPTSSAVLQNVTISSGSTYTASNNATTTLDGTIDNLGTINLTGGNSLNGALVVGNAVTLTGGGLVTLTDETGAGNAFIEGNGQTLTNTDNTIEGTGVIGNGSLALTNGGTIDATPAGGTSTLTLNGSGGVTNTKLMEATGNGTLVIATNVTNTGANITANGGTSAVVITGGAAVTSGTLNTIGTGVVETNPGSSAVLQNVTISSGSTYTASNNATTTLDGTIDNLGTISLTGGNSLNGFLVIGNNVTLAGGGVVSLADQPGAGNAFVEGNGLTLTNTNNTIEGTGVIGSGSLALTNGGTIDATPAGGTSTLTLNGSGGVTNTKLMEASAGGVLVISTTVDNAGASITVADSSSTVAIANATVQGGTLSNSAGGTFETVTSATLDGSTQGALTISAGSTYTAARPGNSDTTFVDGTIDNAGTIQLNGGNSVNGFLVLGNNVTLASGGTVTLSDHSGAGNAFVQGNGLTLTNVDNTIQGTGVIGNGSLSLVNSGTVDATPEADTTTLTLNGSGGVTNNKLLEATGGATLSITNGSVSNLGTVEAQDASAVTYSPGASNANASAGTLTGGIWEAIANGHGATVSVTGGAVSTNAATIVLSGAGSVFQAGNGSTFTTLENSLTSISATGELDVLNLRDYALGVAALGDSGKIVLGGGTVSAGTLTIGGTGELTGSGTVTDLPTNNGTIDANGGNLDVTTAIGGTGRLQIEAASELELGNATGEAAFFEAATGKLRVDNPSTENYTGTINGFSGNDILELANTNATSATPGSFNGTTTTLTVNLNGGGTLTYLLAGNYSADNFAVTHVNGNADSDIALTTITSGTPSISAPTTATVGVGQSSQISGVSVSESPTTNGETFTVVLADTKGVLSANTGATGGGGTITPSGGGTTLTFNGSLSQVNADLTTLADTDATTPSDTISVKASDSNSGTATPASIAVTVNGLPSIAVPSSATVQQNQATKITGVSVSETGNTTTSGETFTVVLADTNGVLSANTGATGGGGSVTPSGGGTTLTFNGSLSQVNADLTTLADDDASTAADTVTVKASDSFGNAATQKSIPVTVTSATGALSISAPTTATVGVGQSSPINGVSISESPTTGGETFTAVLSDTKGVLSANTGATGGGGTITPSGGGTTLTFNGSLSQVNADLTTLADTDATTPSDTISVKASDSNSGTATPASIAVTVNGLPSIAAPSSATVQQNQATKITGVSVSETGNTTTSGETFTVVLADTNGVLSANTGATGGGGSVTPSGGGTTLTFNGSLSQVNADLTTLADDDASTAADTVTVKASDSFGNAATQKSIPVTVTSATGALSISAPTTATVGVGQSSPINGVSISESPTTGGETFTAVLSDTKGVLSANTGATGGGGTITPSGGGTTLTFNGSLSQVNADLTTLADTDATTPSDTISVKASDSNSGTATPASIAVTVNGLPSIAAPSSATVQQNQATKITGVSVSETGNTTTSGETFTVVLADTNGVLSANTGATGGGGSITPSGGGTTLTFNGSLSQVNADLTTLADDDASTAADTVTVKASDSFGNAATQKSIPVTVTSATGALSISAPTTATVGVGQSSQISGVSISESPTTGGETFTVVLSDTKGVLSANTGAIGGGGTITPSGGGTTLTFNGSLSQVNADLTTLADTDATTPSDTISVKASDSNSGTATPASIAVTVNGLPSIAAPSSATVQQNQATKITGVSVSETGNTTTSGETFTVVLADTNGVLSANTGATGGGGSITPSGGGTTLTFNGSLSQVNADLTTLADDDASTAADTITAKANDSFGNTATQKSIPVTVNAGAQIFTLTKGVDTVAGGAGNDTVVAASATLSSGDTIDGGGGTNTLQLTGAGTFDLRAPATLTNIQTIQAQEGQPAYAIGSTTFPAQNQIVYLRDGLNATVNVSSATLNPSNPKPATITIVGANNADVINLGSGNDVVTVGSTSETVHGGTGNNTILVTASTIGASIDGGTGNNALDVTGGGNIVMGSSVVDISTVLLASASGNLSFIANAQSGLVVNDASKGTDTIQAGGLHQTLTGGAGHDLLVGFSAGATTFKDLAAVINGDTISNFLAAGDIIDFTDVNSASLSKSFVENGGGTAGTLSVSDGVHSASVTLNGLFDPTKFHAAPDGGVGTIITYS